MSSDRQVQQDARSYHAGVVTAESFSDELSKSLTASRNEKGEQNDFQLSPEEVAEWERRFNCNNNNGS